MPTTHLNTGTRVTYHGSNTPRHGPGTLIAPCGYACRRCARDLQDRWVLELDTGSRLHHVRRTSFTAHPD